MIARLCTFATVIALAAGSAAAQNRWPGSAPPRPLPARDIKFPPYRIQTLPNGLQVVAVLHHEQPVISMRLLVRAGGALDPKGKNGLAELMASVLTQGAAGKTANELNDEIDFIGGSMDAGAGTDLSYVNVIVMKDSFETGLRLLSDLARRPNFAPEEIERQRQQMLSGMRVTFENPDFIADAVFRRLVFGFHPYGMPQSGTPETIASLTRDDLVAFHRRNFVANNAILAVVGDMTEEEAFAGVQKIFGDWEKRDVPNDTFIAPPDPTRRVVVINAPDAVQTEVRVGHIGVRRNHPDYMALNLAIRILGGEGANRLHQVLRTERGLTYGASADMNSMKESGSFEASTNTRSETTGEALRLMVDEFWRLQRERVSERELTDAKAYMTGSFPLTIETPDAIATQVLNVLFYGLPVEQLETFRQRVNAVTVDDIERVARFYLRPDRLSIVLVGNAAAFEQQLRRIGFGTFEHIDMPALDLTAADFKRAPRVGADLGRPPLARPALASGVPVKGAIAAYSPQSATQAGRTITAEEGASAQALVDQAIAAKGGLEKLRAIKNIIAITTAAMSTPQGRVEAQTTTYLQYPNQMRVETALAGATIVQTYDGKRAWVKDGAGIHEVSERNIPGLEATFKRDTITALLAAHDGTVRARLLPNVKDDSGKIHRALEFSGGGLEPMVMYLDPDTHLVEKQSYIADPGQPIVEEIYSDYKAVDGVQVAFTANVRQGGKALIERRLAEITFNRTLPATLFQRPAS